MSILDQLYDGNVNPSEKYIKKSSEYHKLTLQLNEKETQLFKDFSEKQIGIYENIMEIRGVQQYIAEKDTFVDGFKLGAKIMMQVFLKTPSQFEKSTDD
jgi:hypothetical protein